MNSFLELSLTRKSHEHDLIDKQLFRTAQKTDKERTTTNGIQTPC